jgi:flagellar biosynthesis/type III secretory pathway protein FliH
MAARVGDESFVPFVPRQLTRVSGSLGEREHSSVPEENALQHGVEPNTNAQPESKAERETRAEIEAGAEIQAPTKADSEPSPMPAAPARVPVEVIASRCDHALEIRREAIRLAAIACGRALRHAVLLHPSVIAAFVDDAIAAARLPQHAHIRVHPGSVAHVSATQHDSIGDDDLSLGDVVIECNGVTVGADADTRASLLVTAAAEV